MKTTHWRFLFSILCAGLLACDGASDNTGGGDEITDSGASGVTDADSDGFSADDDCDDTNPAINADAAEICDGIDNDCDGLMDDDDDDVTDAPTWYADGDDDGFGVDADTRIACAAPAGYAADSGDCAADDPTISPGVAEICDGVDNDCSDVVDDAEALGSTEACAAADCVALRDIGDTSGVRWIAPADAAPFEVWCEQDAGGGGWAALWKLTGGAQGTEYSATDIFSGVAPDEVIVPHWEDLSAGVNQMATLTYGTTGGVSLMKVTELFESDGTSIRYNELVAHLNANTLIDLFSRERPIGKRCDTLPDVISLESSDGTVYFGETDQLWQYWNGNPNPTGSIAGVGLATINEADPSRSCQTTSDNLLADPTNALQHPEGNPNENFSYWLGYQIDQRNGQATRCLHHCWTSDWNGGRFDAVTWFGRPSVE